MAGLASAGLAAAGLAAPHVAAASSREWSMIAMEHFPPYNHLKGGELVGLDIDILTEAARELGITMRMLPLPWQRAILSFETGAADGLFQLTPTPRRIRHWHMTGPMRMTRLVFMVPAGSGLADIGGLGGLSGQVVGTVNGFTYGAAFDEAGGFIREGSMDDETSLRKLLLGRASVILGGEANLVHAADRLGVRDRVRILPTPLAQQPRYAAFRRDPAGAGKAALLGTVLRQMTDDGRVERILQRHRPE
ncbi:transporter substrate-binding domain-containing protein [Paracoccus sp. MC1854]|uniref:substrate-binding periplasmic protein n=1 Tax=Paracoccus sp. MC1854 TaxID=2760306 RepID=UPI001600B666|nr:transporter substrate-binding domain-containing protein [Paracoccus sp. MC1854]MBB1490687.1 transporter substrate-binding domain-containing protein [Paracoccus sp. MC1854]